MLSVTIAVLSNTLQSPAEGARQPPNYIACVAAVVCILALFLPTEGDSAASPLLAEHPWLHLTVNQKLGFAYDAAVLVRYSAS